MKCLIIGVVLNATTGEPTNDTSKATLFYFLKGTENTFTNTEMVFEEQESKDKKR